MLWMISVIPSVVLSTIMATIVWIRYRQQRSGQLFIAVVVVQIVLATAAMLRQSTSTPEILLMTAVSSWILLALLSLTMLLFFSALYKPEWWQRPRIIGWISLPYLLATGAILLDSLLGTHLLYQGVRSDGELMRIIPGPLSRPSATLFAAAWLPHLLLLTYTFSRQPQERRGLLVLIGVLIFSTINGYVMRLYPEVRQFSNMFSQIILIGALGYLLLQRKVFATSQVVMDQALAGMDEGIAILAANHTVQFTNRAMEQHLGLGKGQGIEGIQSKGFDVGALQALLGSERLEAILETCEQAITVTASPIINHNGQPQGYLLLSRDVTQSRAYEQALQERQKELLHTIEQLQATQAAERALTETIRSLSLPIIPVADGVIVMPLIGVLDEERVVDFEQRFLQGIQQQHAHTAVLDLTGAPLIDQAAASVMMRAVMGARLLGAQTILVGIRPEIAQSIVALGMAQRGLTTALTLQEALNTLLIRRVTPKNGKVHTG